MRIENLDWDSSFFDLKVGKLDLKNNNLTEDLLDSEFDLIYVQSYKEQEILSSEHWLMKTADSRVVLEKVVEKKETHSNEHICSVHMLTDKLLSLAYQSGIHSRFHDENFPVGSFKRMYSEWISKSISGQLADSVLAYKDCEKILGFITLKEHDDHITIGLIAVDSETRGRGIGQQLLNSANHFARIKNHDRIRVATQGRNKLAIQFYEKNGYSIESKTKLYHCWNKKNRNENTI